MSKKTNKNRQKTTHPNHCTCGSPSLCLKNVSFDSEACFNHNFLVSMKHKEEETTE